MPFFVGDECDYAAFLRGTAKALFPIEAGLEAAGIADILPDWSQRTRAADVAAVVVAFSGFPVACSDIDPPGPPHE